MIDSTNTNPTTSSFGRAVRRADASGDPAFEGRRGNLLRFTPCGSDARAGDASAVLVCALRTAIMAAETESRGVVTRKTIAHRLGVGQSTLESWILPSRDSAIPGRRLFELLYREDLLPDGARRKLWRDLAMASGFDVAAVGECAVRVKDVQREALEVASAGGRLAGVVAAATAAESAGGAAMTRDEAMAVERAADEVIGEAVQVREVAGRAAVGGVGGVGGRVDVRG